MFNGGGGGGWSRYGRCLVVKLTWDFGFCVGPSTVFLCFSQRFDCVSSLCKIHIYAFAIIRASIVCGSSLVSCLISGPVFYFWYKIGRRAWFAYLCTRSVMIVCGRPRVNKVRWGSFVRQFRVSVILL
jgi:hypothetical protein